MGLGKKAKASVHDVRKAAGTAVRFAKPRSIRELTILLPSGESFAAHATARAAVEGALVGDFDPDTYRSDRKDQSIQNLSILSPAGTNQTEVSAGYAEGVILGESQNFTRSLVNEPGNKMTPTILGRRAAEMCKEAGIKCEVFSTEKLHDEKMGAFWAVSQGSAEAARAHRYDAMSRKGPARTVLGLVGKGITFDTGGISIKPSEGMEKMKYDMAGGPP